MVDVVRVRFEVFCDATVLGQSVAVCGSVPFGDWNLGGSLVLDGSRFPTWTGERDIVTSGSDVVAEFKYVLASGCGGKDCELVRWECDGPNRVLRLGRRPPTSPVVLRHRFGEPPGEPDVVATTSLGPPPAATPEAPEPFRNLPAEASAGQGPRRSGAETLSREALEPRTRSKQRGVGAAVGDEVLAALDVEPSVRFTRLVRSSSARALDAKYEVFSNSVLGSGMSGGVLQARVRATGLDVALKTLTTSNLRPRQLEQVMAEVENQLSMDHPNICRLLEVYEEPGRLRLVIERMRGPDLYTHWSRRGRYTERDAAATVRQMCSAVAYCHRHGVCHRDLKLENFCLEDDSEDARLKLIDFGLSETFSALPMTVAVGTLYYVAPEVLNGRYNEKCDLWSLGVITYILLDGRAPFHGADDRRTFQLIKHGKYSCPADRWSQISELARAFVDALLTVDPSKRLDAEEALAHPWLGTVEEEGPSLDCAVLVGMRAFLRSNALKRAVLTAMAPVATVEQVARWADQFEALDDNGDGMVSLKELTTRLTTMLSTTEAEAAALEEAFIDVNGGEEVSYSAFLAACLCANPSLGDQQLRELFGRMDTTSCGCVTVEQVGVALGDVLDVEELRSELGRDTLTYDEFRWLLLSPRFGMNSKGLRQLLGETPSTQWQSWRVETRRAKRAVMESPPGEDKDTAAIEAARRENAAWRLLAHAPGDGRPRSASGVDVAPGADDGASAERVPTEKFLAADLRELPRILNSDISAAWSVATTEAKDGGADAARRENMAWRQWYMEQAAGCFSAKSLPTSLAQCKAAGCFSAKSLPTSLAQCKAES